MDFIIFCSSSGINPSIYGLTYFHILDYNSSLILLCIRPLVDFYDTHYYVMNLSTSVYLWTYYTSSWDELIHLFNSSSCGLFIQGVLVGWFHPTTCRLDNFKASFLDEPIHFMDLILNSFTCGF